MIDPSTGSKLPNLPKKFGEHKRFLQDEVTKGSRWFIRLRWWVPPSIGAGTAVAWLLGVEFAAVPILFVAAFILAYNTVLYLWDLKTRQDRAKQRENVQRFTYLQVALDYAAIFLLIHYTSGPVSPLIFFFIFHIIVASALLPPRAAYGFAAVAAAGMGLIAAGEHLGWIPHHPIIFRGDTLNLADQPYQAIKITIMITTLSFFAASVFIAALVMSPVMRLLRKRIIDLAALSETLTRLNSQLNALFALTQTIGSSHNLNQVLNIVTSELALVMEVKGVSVKLLSDDGKHLRYAAVHGLPNEFLKDRVAEVVRSPLNRRVIEGEPYVTGHVTVGEMYQFGEELTAAHVKSVLFVPLTAEDRVIGILGAYCIKPDRFTPEDVDFLRLAAGLVGIAIDNARAYEAVENLVKERSWFMNRVAHNLRAPLTAMLSILEAVREGYQGELNNAQSESLRRIDLRARDMLAMINGLMTLAERREGRQAARCVSVNLTVLAGRIYRTFEEEANGKGLNFKCNAPQDLPEIQGDPEMIEQLLENLVSNAIKYTPRGGRVELACSLGESNTCRIEISDTGIGIPEEDIPRLFTEFYRADNARAIEEMGTGLGLAIVKEIVDKHGGHIRVESEEGLGTVFAVHLPISCKKGMT
jgi:signal transduction histidine kinase